jgi:hypothetical protein
MKPVDPFVRGQMIGAFCAGAAAGGFFDAKAVVVFSSVLAAGAAVAALVCWRWPGLAAAGWKLWLIGCLANPLFLPAVAFSVDQFECLIGHRSGWNCLFSEVGPLVAGMCLFPPLLGLGWRGWKRRSASIPA